MRKPSPPVAAVLLGAGILAAPAAAQDVRIRVETRAPIAAEIRQAVHEIHRDVVRDLTRELTAAARDVRLEVRGALRDLDRALGVARDATAWQGRNLRAEQEARETHRLSLGASGQLVLNNVSGDITVTAGRGSTTSVEVIRTARGRTADDARRGLERVRTVVTEADGRATVDTQYPNERESAYSVSAAYRVTAPAGLSLTVTSISGDVRVTGLTGGVSVDVVSGDVTLTGVGRVTRARTVSGDLVLTDVTSDAALEAGSMNGDVTIRGLSAPRLTLDTIVGDITASGVSTAGAALKTLSGDVAFGGPLAADGRYEFQSHSGTIRLTFDPDASFTLQATTFSGEIRPAAGLDLKVDSQSRRALRATAGRGGATIIATTFSGTLVLAGR